MTTFNSKAVVTEQSPGASRILCLPLNAGLSNNRQKLSTTQNKELQEIKKEKKKKKENTVSLPSPLLHADQQLPVPGSQSPDQHFGEFEKHRAGSGASCPALPRHSSQAAPALIDTDAGGFIKLSRAHKHATSLLTASRAQKSTEGRGEMPSEPKNFESVAKRSSAGPAKHTPKSGGADPPRRSINKHTGRFGQQQERT